MVSLGKIRRPELTRNDLEVNLLTMVVDESDTEETEENGARVRWRAHPEAGEGDREWLCQRASVLLSAAGK